MVTIKKLPIKFTFLPSKAWWLFFGVLLLGVVVMISWTRKSSQPLAVYLPANTTFFYNWTDPSYYENLGIDQISIINTQEPTAKIAELKKILQNGFLNTQEVIWFKTGGSSDDNFLLRLDKGKETVKWLVANRPEYSYLLVDDGVLLLSVDDWLPNHYATQDKIDFDTNNLGVGVNIFWSKNEAPIFLADLTKLLQLDNGLPSIYANIYKQRDGQVAVHIWQDKLRQVINASSTVAWPNQAKFPLNADLVFGFGEHKSDKWQGVVSQNIIQTLFTELPYYRLSDQKIEEQILKNNFIYLSHNNWLMVSPVDWQSRINDWVPNLKVKESKNRLPDGTVYTEFVSDEGAEVESLHYQQYDYWHFGQFYGTQIGAYYYLSNSETLIQSTLLSKYNIQSYLGGCQIAGDYQIIDLAQVNTAKIQNDTIKEALQKKNINYLTVLSYESNAQIGLKACVK